MNDLFESAKNNDKSETHNFFLKGDLSQMSTKKQFLLNKGFSIQQNNVYPCLKESDVKNALTAIWKNKVEGWWHYKEEYIKHNICTKEEFKNGF
jgi:hypothetical protein